MQLVSCFYFYKNSTELMFNLQEYHEHGTFLLLCLMELILRHVEFVASHNRVVQSHVSVSLGLIGRMFTSKTVTSAGIVLYLVVIYCRHL